MSGSPVVGQYDTAIDRESAYEILEKREEEAAERAERLAEEEEAAKRQAAQKKTRRSSSSRDTVWESSAKNAGRTVVRELTRYVLRGVLGGRR